MLLDAIFLAICLATLEKESIVSCRRHVTRYNLELPLNASKEKQCNVTFAESRTKIYSMQPLQAQNCCETPETCLATPLQHKLQTKLHHMTLVAELGFTFSNNF